MIKRRAFHLVALLLLVWGPGHPLLAQKQGAWVYLGEANVDGAVDHDRITVGRADGRFRAIQIRVERAPVEFQRVVVHFANGGEEEVVIKERIAAGGRTRAINLRGRDRIISSVEFWYGRAKMGSDRPQLRLFGR